MLQNELIKDNNNNQVDINEAVNYFAGARASISTTRIERTTGIT